MPVEDRGLYVVVAGVWLALLAVCGVVAVLAGHLEPVIGAAIAGPVVIGSFVLAEKYL